MDKSVIRYNIISQLLQIRDASPQDVVAEAQIYFKYIEDGTRREDSDKQ